MWFAPTFAALSVVASALATPTRVPITKRAGPVKPNSYIVTFKDSSAKDAYVNSNPSFNDPQSKIVYDYTLIDAAAMMLHNQDLDDARTVSGVESIEPDSIMSINYEVNLDGFEPTRYELASDVFGSLEKRGVGRDGEGVMVYGIDTGIYTQHNCFGGRALWGAVFTEKDTSQMDGNGHGTHTAGTAIGEGFKPGVATKANMTAVKVLSSNGSGTTSGVIAGVDWACTDAKGRQNLSIATMSLGGAPNTPLDSAVRNCIAQGMHFTIAAGNSAQSADTTSPARVEETNTIGAVDCNNTQAYFSNYGPLIDAWYYGVNVTSAWIDGPDSNKTLSGTSMSTPGVAAICAKALSEYGPMSPAELSQALKENAKSVVNLTMGQDTSTDKLANPW